MKNSEKYIIFIFDNDIPNIESEVKILIKNWTNEPHYDIIFPSIHKVVGILLASSEPGNKLSFTFA